MVGMGFAFVRQKLTQCHVGNDCQSRRVKTRLRTLGKTFGGAMALICLISTLALAQGQQGQPQTMTCTKVDDREIALRPERQTTGLSLSWEKI
jgi:hypothetical protein